MSLIVDLVESPQNHMGVKEFLAAMDAYESEDLFFITPKGTYKALAPKNTILATISALSVAGAAGTFQSEQGWGVYLGSVSTIYTILATEAVEEGTPVDIPFGPDHEEEKLDPDEELRRLRESFEAWENGGESS